MRQSPQPDRLLLFLVSVPRSKKVEVPDAPFASGMLPCEWAASTVVPQMMKQNSRSESVRENTLCLLINFGVAALFTFLRVMLES